MTDRPTILQIADRIGSKPGFDPPTPRWRATLAYLYGLPLSDVDVTELVAATGRSAEAIYSHADRVAGRRRFRQLWARVGRRGRKSATAALIAVYEAVYGGHEADVLPGEQGLCAVISRDLAGASVVTRFVRLFLDALGIRYSSTRIGAVSILEIEGSQIGIATLAATSEAPRGYALPVIILDEFAHHPTGDEFEHTSESIFDAAIPAQMQFADPLLVAISTPLGKLGKFHESVEASLGNEADERALAVQGASWEWGTVPEATVRAELSDPRVFAREGMALPQEAALAALDPDHVERAFLPRPFVAAAHGEPIMVLDPSSGRGDEFTACVAFVVTPPPADTVLYRDDRRERDARPDDPIWRTGVTRSIPQHGDMPLILRVDPATGAPLKVVETFRVPVRDATGAVQIDPTVVRQSRPYIRVEQIVGIGGRFFGSVTAERIVSELAAIAKKRGIRSVHSDPREELGLQSLFRQQGLRFTPWKWPPEAKSRAMSRLRRWLADDVLSICDDAETKRQLLAFEEKISPSGYFTYGGRRGRHDDRAALFLTLAMVDEGGALPRSDLSRRARAQHQNMV